QPRKTEDSGGRQESPHIKNNRCASATAVTDEVCTARARGGRSVSPSVHPSIRAMLFAGVAVVAAAAAPHAAAQPIVLTQSNATTLRGGAYASTNFAGAPVETRASADASYVRRALFKFDTHTTLAAGTP